MNSNDEPKFIPPSSDAALTDAVKEAIARAIRHKDCELGDCHAAREGVVLGSKEYRAIVTECEPAQKTAPLLVALAEAERKLADANACSTCGGMAPSSGVTCICGGTNSREHEIDGLRNCVYDTEAKLANAEKRAKEAEAGWLQERSRPPYPTAWAYETANEILTEQNAALTRKLAVAQNGIERAMEAHGDVGTHMEALGAQEPPLRTRPTRKGETVMEPCRIENWPDNKRWSYAGGEYEALGGIAIGDLSGTLVFKWKPLTWRERLALFLGGRVYVSVMTFGKPLQPFRVDAAEPEFITQERAAQRAGAVK